MLGRLSIMLALFAGPAWAAETSDLIDRVRVRSGAWVGATVMQAQLQFRAPSAEVDTRIDALPQVSFGVDLWPEERLGLYAAASVGLGAQIELPDLDATFDYNAHIFEAGGRYRWYLGPRSEAPALFAGIGARAIHQDTQRLRPALLVDSTVAGPEVAGGFEWPVLGPTLWLRGTLRAGVPFFVRETPEDTGDARDFVSYGGRLEASGRIHDTWGLALMVDAAWRSIDFVGIGTRAAGIRDGSTEDRFLSAMVALRRGL